MDRRHRLLRIASIFEKAVDLTPEEQARLMDLECGDNTELRREVQKLLDADVTEPPRVIFHPPTELEPAAAIGDTACPDKRPLNDATTAVTLGTRLSQSVIPMGARIGPYRIVEQLGEGGMGAVFLARHEELRHDAVVKVLLPQATGPSSILRFEREAEVAAMISHPGVVRVMDRGHHKSGNRFILMERLHGGSLRDRLLGAGSLSPRTAILFAIQTARALEAVHVHCVHRDIKPDNLVLLPDPVVPGGERVKIIDFGIAKPHNRSKQITPYGTLIGTPPYMAPEQFCDAANVDERADLYSLGVVLFQMLCGQLPLQCQSVREYMEAHNKKQTLPSVERYVQVSSDLSHVVARLLAKGRRERFQSARALVEALEALPEIQDASSALRLYTKPQAMALEAVEPMHEPAYLAPGDTAPVITTEPQAMVPEAVEPMHEPAYLAPGDTAPAITVVIGGKTWRLTSSEATRPG